MAKLVWDAENEKLYENGVRKGVLYPWDDNAGWYGNGVVWNGLTNVQTTPSGGEASDQYADDIKYVTLYSLEENGATIEAFWSPEEFDECDGSVEVPGTLGLMARAQSRKTFGFCWRTNIGNDKKEELGYKLHLLYGCKASPTERSHPTINDSPEAGSMSWEVNTTAPALPAALEGKIKPTALFEIDSRKFVTTEQKALLAALENKLYGTNASNPELPTIAELASLLGVTAYNISWAYDDIVLSVDKCTAGDVPVYKGIVPIKTGYTFLGWNSDSSASTALATLPEASADATYYAIYQQNE